MTPQDACKIFNCSMEQLKAQYLKNAAQLNDMAQKAVTTGKKVNGYTAHQLADHYMNFIKLAEACK